MWKDKLAPANSPRQLNELGENVLEESGVKQISDTKKKDLLKLIKKDPPATAYDAEVTIMNTVADLQEHFPNTTT